MANVDLSLEGSALVLGEGAILESDNVACLSLPKTSLNEGRSGEEVSNMYGISLFLYCFNIRGDRLINIEFLPYTPKLVIIVVQRQITQTQGEIILMKIINLFQIVNARVKFLGLFPNKFSSW